MVTEGESECLATPQQHTWALQRPPFSSPVPSPSLPSFHPQRAPPQVPADSHAPRDLPDLISARVAFAVPSCLSVIVAGGFYGTATFDSDTLTSGGSSDVFVARVSGSGAFLWAMAAGGNTEYNRAVGVGVDASAGAVYVTGSYDGTATFGSHTITGSGGQGTDLFVAKFLLPRSPPPLSPSPSPPPG